MDHSFTWDHGEQHGSGLETDQVWPGNSRTDVPLEKIAWPDQTPTQSFDAQLRRTQTHPPEVIGGDAMPK